MEVVRAMELGDDLPGVCIPERWALWPAHVRDHSLNAPVSADTPNCSTSTAQLERGKGVGLQLVAIIFMVKMQF